MAGNDFAEGIVVATFGVIAEQLRVGLGLHFYY